MHIRTCVMQYSKLIKLSGHFLQVKLWLDLTKPASIHTMARQIFTTTQLLHQWTNNPCVYHCQWFPHFPGLLFLGLVFHTYLMCSSARVVFKWQWCEWTSTHLAGNCHMTGLRAFPSNWLAYLWYLELKQASNETIWQCSTCTHRKTCHFMILHFPWLPPLCNHFWHGIKSI